MIRYCKLEGAWYPRQPELDRELSKGFTQQVDKGIRFVIAPHAGLVYSEPVEATVFSKVDASQFDKVIILAVAHRFHVSGLEETPFDEWQNPLNGELINVEKLPNISFVDKENCQREHSAEVLMPYICKIFTNSFKLSVVFCGGRPTDNVRSLLPFCTNALYVISSDFCHYGPAFNYNPVFNDMTAEQTIDKLNMDAVECIKQSSKLFGDYVQRTRVTICGRYTIETGLFIMEQHGGYEAQMTLYDASSQVASRDDRSVSYVGMVGRLRDAL